MRPRGSIKRHFDWIDAIIYRCFMLGDPYISANRLADMLGYKSNSPIYQRADRILDRIWAHYPPSNGFINQTK
jgi:hypothetical protein